MNAPRILIVEDDAALRALYQKKLGQEGYDVVTVENGLQAIESITAKSPDLVLCDVRMQTADGFQVLEKYPKKIRKFQFVFLTNFDTPELREKAKQEGTDGYLIKKDVTLTSLTKIVSELLAKGHPY